MCYLSNNNYHTNSRFSGTVIRFNHDVVGSALMWGTAGYTTPLRRMQIKSGDGIYFGISLVQDNSNFAAEYKSSIFFKTCNAERCWTWTYILYNNIIRSELETLSFLVDSVI